MRIIAIENRTHIVNTKAVTSEVVNRVTGEIKQITVEYVQSDKILKGANNGND